MMTAFDRLEQIHRILTMNYNRRLKTLKLRNQESQVLNVLSREGSCSVSELSELILADPRSRLKSSSVIFFFHPLVEFFCGIRGFDLIQLTVHFFIGREQSELLCAPHQDLGLNQLVQNAQAKAHCLFAHRLLIRTGSLVGVVLVYFAAVNLAAIHGRHYVAAGRLAVAAKCRKQQTSANQDEASWPPIPMNTVLQCSSSNQRRSGLICRTCDLPALRWSGPGALIRGGRRRLSVP